MWNKLFILELVVLTGFFQKGTSDKSNLGTYFYEDIGCKPISQNDTDYPVKFDCKLKYKEGYCLLRNELIALGQELNDSITDPSCHIHCGCETNGKFFCGELDCIEAFHRPKTNCYYKYELGQCCSVGEICFTEDEEPLLKVCEVNGRKYRVGEEFFPENTCKKCICDEKFNGKFDDSNCINLVCNSQITYGEQIKEYCAPFYGRKNADGTLAKKCCPDEFICASETDRIITINPKAPASGTRCQFGSKYLKVGEGVKKYFSFFGQWTKAICECVLPPFLTCTDVE